MVLCMNFAMIFTYAAELFPTELRGLTLGLCLLFGRFATMLSILFEIASDNLGIHPMVTIILGSSLSIPVAWLLPETQGKRISN